MTTRFQDGDDTPEGQQRLRHSARYTAFQRDARDAAAAEFELLRAVPDELRTRLEDAAATLAQADADAKAARARLAEVSTSTGERRTGVSTQQYDKALVAVELAQQALTGPARAHTVASKAVAEYKPADPHAFRESLDASIEAHLNALDDLAPEVLGHVAAIQALAMRRGLMPQIGTAFIESVLFNAYRGIRSSVAEARELAHQRVTVSPEAAAASAERYSRLPYYSDYDPYGFRRDSAAEKRKASAELLASLTPKN
jgi:hypothetical protein